MTTITLDLGRMTAAQLATLEAILANTRQVPSKTRNEIAAAGESNCGALDYDYLYQQALNKIEEVK